MSLKQDPKRLPGYRPVQLGEEVPFQGQDEKGPYIIGPDGKKIYKYGQPDGSVIAYDQDGYALPPQQPTNEYAAPSTGTGSPDQSQQSPFGATLDPSLIAFMDRLDKRAMERVRYENDPKRIEELIAVTEPFETRRAQRQQELGLQSQAVGFALKGLPDMLMKAYASRAAYYPEMIRGTVDGLTRGFDSGVAAAKPRFDYYSGVIT